jgi:hypothetical protein
VVSLDNGERAAASQVGARAVARVVGEEQAEVRSVGIEEGEAPEVVGRIAGHDREPGIQEVVALLKEGSVVPGKGFDRAGDARLEAGSVAVVRDHRE